MLTLQHSPALRITPHTRKSSKQDPKPVTAVPVAQVREMLLEIAFVLHATRAVAKLDPSGAVKLH